MRKTRGIHRSYKIKAFLPLKLQRRKRKGLQSQEEQWKRRKSAQGDEDRILGFGKKKIAK